MVSSYCLFCSPETIKVIRKIKPVFRQCAAGLTCSLCHETACRNCLLQIYSRLVAKIINAWASDVGDFLRLPKDLPFPAKKFAGFIGHCCEFKSTKGKMRAESRDYMSMCKKKKRLDGAMHLFEFDLLVATSFESTDVLGLGGCRDQHLGAVHGVISLETATDLELHDVRAKAWKETIPGNKISIHTIETEDPFDSTSKVKVSRGLCNVLFISLLTPLTHFVQTIVEIISLPQVHTFPEARLGENNPTSEEITRSVLYSGEKSRPDVDVTIITGRFTSSPSHEALLLMRFHKVVPDLSRLQIQNLFNAIKPKSGKKGYEVVRRGGSSGTTTLDPHFFTFIGAHGNLPRMGRGVKFERLQKKWVCHYIRTPSSKGTGPASHEYGPPRVGGSFDLSPSHLVDYPFLTKFAKTKIDCALLLDHLNHLPSRTVKIQPGAVFNELNNLAESLRFVKDSPPSPEFSFEVSVLVHCNTFQRHTLVCHPVGYHRDVFSRYGLESLENKVCFVYEGYGGLGRGGCDGKFVFALLDWLCAPAKTNASVVNRPKR